MSSAVPPANWVDFVKAVRVNHFLQEESTDTSLQPGEEYPLAPHLYMAEAHLEKTATMNQITTLLSTKPSEVQPAEAREMFTEQKLSAQTHWLYPYTVENPCGTQSFIHWQTAFNTAVIQIVSSQFSSQRRITREGRDLYSTASTKFLPDDTSTANTTTSHGLQMPAPAFESHVLLP